MLSVKRECRDVEDFCPLLQGPRHRPESGLLFARKLKMFLHRSRAKLLHRRRRRCQTSQERLDGTSHHCRSIGGIARLIWGIWKITDTLKIIEIEIHKITTTFRSVFLTFYHGRNTKYFQSLSSSGKCLSEKVWRLINISTLLIYQILALKWKPCLQKLLKLFKLPQI